MTPKTHAPGSSMRTRRVARRRSAARGRATLPRLASSCASPVVLALCGALQVTGAHAAAPLGPGTLPVAAPNFVTSGSVSATTLGNTLTINQATPRAVLNWQSFNIGADAAVRFQQPGASAAALNRIFDANPSLIQGRLSANGQIYLINQNGIVFGSGAQVNVGSLVASTLNISNESFERGLLSFALGEPAFRFEGNAQQFQNSLIRIESGAELRAENGGRILMFAPRIENRGLISTPEGQTVLAAGSRVYLNAPFDSALRGFLVEVDPFTDATDPTVNLSGSVLNETVGRIIAERGNVSLAALAVNQNGLVRATTSVRLNGSLILAGRDTVDAGNGTNQTTIGGVAVSRGARGGSVTFGPGSVTEVRPELGDTRTTQDSQPFTASSIDIAARTVTLLEGAAVSAPSGSITISGQRGGTYQDPNATGQSARVYVASGASIDASGTRGSEVPVERNFIEIDLTGTELRDAPLQRDSFLRNSRVTVDVRRGTPLTDIAPFVGQVQRDIGERTATGGSVVLRSESDLILRAGSLVDVSGGGIRYLDGFSTATQLASAGVVFDIANASPDRVYQGFAGQYTTPASRWGPATTSAPVPQFIVGYREGRAAGSVSLLAPSTVIDGAFRASVDPGPNQRTIALLPLGGALTIGDAAGASSGNFSAPAFRFSTQTPLLPSTFDAGSQIPLDRLGEIVLTPANTTGAGFSRLSLFSNRRFTIDADASLMIAPGGSLAVTARSAEIAGSVHAPSGSISIIARNTVDNRDEAGNPLGAEAYRVTLAPGSVISTAGLWTNDLVSAATAPVALNGGTVALSALSDVIVGAGSTVDVSAGAQLSAAGALVASGNAGTAAFSSGRFGADTRFDPQFSSVVLDGSVTGFGMAAGARLSIATSKINIGGAPGSTSSEFMFDPVRFGAAGFRDWVLGGQDGVSVAPGAALISGHDQRVLLPGANIRPSGGTLAQNVGLAGSLRRPADLRSTGNITLNALGPATGTIEIGAGAQLAADPGGALVLNGGLQITVAGALSAPAGRIALTLPPANVDDGFNPTQSIWLAPTASLAAPGYFRARNGAPAGVRDGEVLDGGSVSLDAARGYLIGLPGSTIDVSGIAAIVDVVSDAALGGSRTPVMVGSPGGRIALSAREGIALDSTFNARSGAVEQVPGGQLSVLFNALPLSNFPAAPRRIIVGEHNVLVPQGLQPGQTVDLNPFDPVGSLVTGRAFVDVPRVTAGGIASVKLSAGQSIDFSGTTVLSAPRTVALDAPDIRLAPSSQVRIETAYAVLGNTDPSRQAAVVAPAAGDASLAVDAGLVDLVGSFSLSGSRSASFSASSDVRLRGAQSGPTSADLVGRLWLQGDLAISAQRVFPTTLSQFTLDLPGAASTASFTASGSMIDTPLSALGSLTVNAATIEQAGRVHAPFGSITLAAREQLTLAAGGLTSVSSGGATIPVGRTELSGRDYVYTVGDRNRVISELPAPRITLRSERIDTQLGATVDLRGGGDLMAYEFTVGPGGSRDLLDPSVAPTAFAVLPGLAGAFAPHDLQYLVGTGEYRPGDRVTLSGVPGLGAGSHLRLPARYALLPGAFLVTPVAGSNDFRASQAGVEPDGTLLAAGRLETTSAGGAILHHARTNAFRVVPSSLVRSRAEYRDTLASRFFAATSSAPQTADAGRLVVEAQRSLVLDAGFETAAGAGGRGTQVDLVADRIALLGGSAVAPAPDFVSIDVTALNALGAQSLLIGGTRSSTSTGDRIAVRASTVVLANDAGSPLRGPEVIVAATGEVKLAAGSHLQSTGSNPGAPRALLIDAADGDGALVRISSGAQAALSRSNIDRDRGTLILEPGSLVRSTGSLILDATRDHQSSATLALSPGSDLALGASRISAGATQGVTEGLVLPALTTNAFAMLRTVTLRSYSTLDLFGPVSLGAPALGQLSIEAAGIGGYAASASDTMVLAASSISLANPNGLAFSVAPPFLGGQMPQPGSGALRIESSILQLGAGAAGSSAAPPLPFTTSGFNQTRLLASDSLQVAGSGGLAVIGDLRVETARIIAVDAANYSIAAVGSGLPGSGSLSTAVSAAPLASSPISAAPGARLTLSADQTVVHGTRIETPSGDISLRAGQGIVLAPGSRLDTSSASTTIGGTVVAAAAGTIRLASAAGDIEQQAGATLDVSGRAGADAGQLAVSAVAGDATLSGALLGTVERGTDIVPPRGAGVSIDAARIGDVSALNNRINGVSGAATTNFTESRNFRARAGDMTIDAGATVRARRIELGVDDGNLLVRGRLDATGSVPGEQGGDVLLFANRGASSTGGSVILDSGATIAAAAAAGPAAEGTRGRRGNLSIGIVDPAGSAELRAGATIDLSASGGAAGGRIVIRAPRTGAGAGTDVAVAPIGAQIVGQRETVVEAVRVFAGVNSIASGTSSAATLGIGSVASDVSAFMANAGPIETRLGRAADPTFRVHAGVEVRSSGALTLSSDWNLWSASRPGGEPGTLTLRAGTSLNLTGGSLSDAFSTAAPAGAFQNGVSWSYRLIAGADFASANPLQTAAGSTGSVTIGSANAARLVRTGTGSIDIAAAGDVQLVNPVLVNATSPASVVYTAGTRAPALADFANPVVSEQGAVFPIDGGDLTVRAGRDVVAPATRQLVSDWLYRQGRLNTDGTVQTANRPSWWIRFGDFRQGFGALAGGDVSIEAGRDVLNVSAVVPSTGRLPGTAGSTPDVSALRVTGGGDLQVRAGGDIASGLFTVDRGELRLRADGSLRSGRVGGQQSPVYTLLGLADSSARVEARSVAFLEGVFNPTVLTQAPNNVPTIAREKKASFFTYSPEASVSLTALGSATLFNNPANVVGLFPQQFTVSATSANEQSALVTYPGSLKVASLAGDIEIPRTFAMYPSATGSLEMLAAGDIRVDGTIQMSNLAPGALPQVTSPTASFLTAISRPLIQAGASGAAVHSDPSLRTGDDRQLVIAARDGSVTGRSGVVFARLPKPAAISAGTDLRDLWLFGQNLEDADITRLSAGRDIVFSTLRDTQGRQLSNASAIEIGGPGRAELGAGRNIDLGNAVGVVSRGSLNNPFLPERGASLLLVAGSPGPDYAGFIDWLYSAPAPAPDALRIEFVSATTAYLPPERGTLTVAVPEGTPVPAELTRFDLRPAIAGYVRSATGQSGLSDADAYAAFRTLPAAQQRPLVNALLFTAIRTSGRAAALSREFSDFDLGYGAIERLFPASAKSPGGDINLFFSQLRTEQGGNIDLLAPAGLVNAGLANPGELSRSPGQLGIISAGGGSIRSMSSGDFLVNQSRVFTLGGGDILLWSSSGSIDAGRGARTATATPPPQILVRGDQIVLDTSNSVSGSGIGVLLGRSNIAPGDVDLYAPRGAIDAGDAGIRSSGRAFLFGERVIIPPGALSAAAGVTGAPAAATGAIGGLASTGSAAASATRTAEQAATGSAAKAAQAAQSAPGTRPAFVTVEVIGLGD